MKAEEIVTKLAFLRCNDARLIKNVRAHNVPPCERCINKVMEDLLKSEFIDAELIETTAICIANNKGNYDANKLTPLELSFAYALLEDIVPEIAERVRRDSNY